jgi:hypothetical protein
MANQEECDVAVPGPRALKVFVALNPRNQPYDESMDSLNAVLVTTVAAGIGINYRKIRRGVPGWHNAGPSVSEFMKDKEATHMFLAADDMLYPPDILIRLTSHDKDVVSGTYRKGSLSPCLANYETDVDEMYRHVREGGVYETKFAAGHTMLIAKRVIEKMIRDYPELAYFGPLTEETHYGLFLPMIEKGLVYHDDWAFSVRAKRSGFTLWNDYGVRCKHYCSDFLAFEAPAEGPRLVEKSSAA